MCGVQAPVYLQQQHQQHPPAYQQPLTYAQPQLQLQQQPQPQPQPPQQPLYDTYQQPAQAQPLPLQHDQLAALLAALQGTAAPLQAQPAQAVQQQHTHYQQQGAVQGYGAQPEAQQHEPQQQAQGYVQQAAGQLAEADLSDPAAIKAYLQVGALLGIVLSCACSISSGQAGFSELSSAAFWVCCSTPARPAVLNDDPARRGTAARQWAH